MNIRDGCTVEAAVEKLFIMFIIISGVLKRRGVATKENA
jgi:hypothetical protein